jgi:capsular polysaccharide export protein
LGGLWDAPLETTTSAIYLRAIKAAYLPERSCQSPPRKLRKQRNLMVWASADKDLASPDVRVEDGFLRSWGLGATLIPPLSLVTDRLGIYYDPRKPSQLEQMVANAVTLRPDQITRAKHLHQQIT